MVIKGNPGDLQYYKKTHDHDGNNSKILPISSVDGQTEFNADHDHDGTDSAQINNQNILLSQKNYGLITNVDYTSATTITIKRGCAMMIDGKYLELAADSTISRARSNANEIEYLYCYNSGDALVFVMSATVPVYDYDKGYWVQTGTDTRRWSGLNIAKNSSGNFYIFTATGSGANRVYLQVRDYLDLQNSTLASGGVATCTFSARAYQPTVSNIVATEGIIYSQWSSAGNRECRLAGSNANSNYYIYDYAGGSSISVIRSRYNFNTNSNTFYFWNTGGTNITLYVVRFTGVTTKF